MSKQRQGACDGAKLAQHTSILIIDRVLGVLHGQVLLPEKKMRFLTETVHLHFLLSLSILAFPFTSACVTHGLVALCHFR